MWKNRHLTGALGATLLFACMHAGAAFSYSPNYTDHVDLTVPGYASGSNTLTNFPLLVRLSEQKPYGFKYVRTGDKGKSIRFWATDTTGANGQFVPHEIDTWNESGESLVWVKLPKLNNNAKLKLVMYWGEDAQNPPAFDNDSAAVWSDYAGVWHMSSAYDSTSNHAASAFGPAATAETGTLLGTAYGVNGAGNNGPILYASASDALNALTNDCSVGFVASMALKLNSPDQQYGFLFSRKSAETTPAYGYQFRGSGGSSASGSWWMNGTSTGDHPYTYSVSLTPGAWHRVDVEFNANFLYIWIDGKRVGQRTGPAIRQYVSAEYGLAIGGVLADAVTGAYGNGNIDGTIDEFRIRSGTIGGSGASTSMRLDAEIAQWKSAEYVAFTNLYQNKKVYNYWRTEPKMTQTVFESGVTTEEIIASIVPGTSVAGTEEDVTYVFEDCATGATTNEVPTAGGTYRLHVTVPETATYSAATKAIEFRIVEHKPSPCVATDEEERLARTLLMNSDDTFADAEILMQGYGDTDSSIGPYWQHLDEYGDDAEDWDYYAHSWYYNFCGGTRHIYRTPSGARLWELTGARFGNTYDQGVDGTTEETGMQPDQNYLPYNPASYVMTDRDYTQVGEMLCEAGQAVLVNRAVEVGNPAAEGAAIFSPCYTNGIGTVYFDAVNSHTNNAGSGYYKVKLEIATNTIYYSESAGQWLPREQAPLDEYVKYEWTDSAGAKHVNDYGLAGWQTVPMHVVRYDWDADEGEFATTDLGTCTADDGFDLAIRDGHVCDAYGDDPAYRFYRFYVPLTYRGHIRFRIVRTSEDPDQTVNREVGALILVDNVVVSKPTARVDLEPYGWYDSEKTGKQVLGQEIALTTPFPSCNDSNVVGRARGVVTGGELGATQMLASAEMHYRWRYLGQKATEWAVSDLRTATLVGRAPLDLPYHLPGDVEFYYTLYQNSPYYKLVDYTGRGLEVPGYSEEITMTTNYPSADQTSLNRAYWFVRLRDGRSDVESMTVVWQDKGDGYATVRAVPMEVVDNHAWRGYLQTTTNLASKTIRFRFERRNAQEAGAAEWSWNTNYWHYADAVRTLPAAGRLEEAGPTDWKEITFEPTTGYLMFQLDDETRAITIVHADYQNFNRWHDAAKGHFVGAAQDADVPSSGVSPEAKDYEIVFKDVYGERPSESTYWTENFNIRGYDHYVPFRAGVASGANGWSLGRGMITYAAFRDDTTGNAYQMSGCGEGYMDMTGPASYPVGVGTVSFNARVAQEAHPEYMTYLDGGSAMKNYLVMTRVNFGTARNQDFLGNASVSLFAHFRDTAKGGGYEARWEHIRAQKDSNDWVIGADTRGQRLALYRWAYDSDGVMRGTLLVAATNGNTAVSSEEEYPTTPDWNFLPPTTEAANTNLVPFFVSAYVDDSGRVCLSAGVKCGTLTGKSTVGYSATDANERFASGLDADGRWYLVNYRDATDGRFRKGSFGFGTANCNGIIVRPQLYTNNTDLLKGYFGTARATATAAKQTIAFKPALFEEIRSRAEDEEFLEDPRIVTQLWDQQHPGDRAWTNCWGFAAAAVSNTVDVYLRAMGKSGENDWVKKGSVAVTGYGKPMASRNTTVSVWDPGDWQVRLMTGGTMSGYRTDVTVDHIKVTQWGGTNVFGRVEKPSYSTSDCYDYCFTSGWMTDEALKLSAKRTKAGVPCSVRSPVFDRDCDNTDGLGLFYFEYENAQPNVRLLLQICTNWYDSAEGIVGLTTQSSKGLSDGNGNWHTVTNYTYADLGSAGTKTVYFGYHGVKGLMRLCIDPDLVTEMKGDSATDPDNFGEIDITRVICRDEPNIDLGSWWGWNIRAIGDETDKEAKMFLPDPDEAPTGLSIALNNSVTEDIDPDTDPDLSSYPKHQPFIQSPTFTNNVVGEVSFRARKWDLSDASQAAEVTLYAAPADGLSIVDTNWTALTRFVVSNTTFATYTYKVDQGSGYKAFRLAVTGVEGVKYPGPGPTQGANPVRVLLDEVVVSEAVRASLGFRRVGAFRDGLGDEHEVSDITASSQQPLTGESWGVQGEVYATMLEDELDKSFEPRVRLRWFRGTEPWGYAHWKNLSAAGSAWLSKAAEYSSSNMVFRSSYLSSPNAVMLPEDEPGTVVQYALEVIFKTVNAKTGLSTFATNVLDDTQWENPSWYAPVDYNSDPDYGAGRTDGFSAYTILDDVAPGWAWINECNIFGGWVYYLNGDEDRQYIEIAAPVAASLDDWQVHLLSANLSTRTVITNIVAWFGQNGLEAKKSLNEASNMVFHVIASQKTSEAGTLSAEQGEIDGIWHAANHSQVDKKTGEIEPVYPIAVQLVRPSGVVEHQIVVIGTNDLEAASGNDSVLSQIEFLNNALPKAKFFFPGDDAGGTDGWDMPKRSNMSLGVVDSRGEAATVWTNLWICSPGRVNEDGKGHYQQIENPPVPNGESVIIYAKLDQTGGGIVQTVGEAVETTATQTLLVRRGNADGTNVTYRVEPWYEVASVTEVGDGDRPHVLPKSCRTLTVNVGAYASNTITVTAKAGVDSRLVDYGIDENNRYTPAVIKWLQDATDAYGNSFAHPEGDIALADLIDADDRVVTNMTLTQMYWLDMDPTVSNLALKAYVSGTPYGHEVTDPPATNIRMSVFLEVTNRTEELLSPHYADAWSPYVLRGLVPGYTSWDYAKDLNKAWTSETFRIVGRLLNKHTSDTNGLNWAEVRRFVFEPDSFYQPDDGVKAYTSEIEVEDPHVPGTRGYTAWGSWFKDHPDEDVTWSFMIDDLYLPFRAELMKTNNWYQVYGE